MRSIQKHKTPTPEAFEACFDDGAVIFSGVIDRSVALTFTKTNYRSPFLDQIELILGDLSGRIVDEYSPTNGIDHSVVSAHTDLISPTGLSVLMPITDNRALFLVADDFFTATREEVLLGDNHVQAGYYGLGDAILLRQDIRKLNGSNVGMRQAFHGAFRNRGSIVGVDYLSPIVNLDFSNLDSGSECDLAESQSPHTQRLSS